MVECPVLQSQLLLALLPQAQHPDLRLGGQVIAGELKQEVISTSGKAQSPQWLCMLMAKLCWLEQVWQVTIDIHYKEL